MMQVARYGRRATDRTVMVEIPVPLPEVTELFGVEGHLAWNRALTEQEGGKFHDTVSDLTLEDMHNRGDFA